MKPEITLDDLYRKDPRYSKEAYEFVSDALEFTVSELSERRHVSGQELSEGIRRYALQEFGPLAREVLHSWGIRTTADFGEIVYNLIDIGVMGKTDDDRREDFHNVYDLNAAFEEGFRIVASDDEIDM